MRLRASSVVDGAAERRHGGAWSPAIARWLLVVGLLAALLCGSALLAQGVAAADASPELEGEGTADSPYEVGNATELQRVGEAPSAHYVLVDDVNATATADWNDGSGFEPVALDGSLDGQGHRVVGLAVNRSGSDVGAFSLLNGTVRNLTLASVSIEGNGTAGGLVGRAHGATVRDVRVTGAVEGRDGVGAVVGATTDSTVRDATTNASVAGRSGVGGLVGTAIRSRLASATSDASVVAENRAGGVVGATTNATLQTLISRATVSSGGDGGGVVGAATETLLADVASNATVSGSNDVGGVAGAAADSQFEAVSSRATVDGEDEVGGVAGAATDSVLRDVDSDATVDGDDEVGGVAGTTADSELRDVASGAEVDGDGEAVGGAVGAATASELRDVSSSAEVDGGDATGGVVGVATESLLDAVSADGTVDGARRVGGVAGATTEATLRRASADATVSGTAHVGGAVGVTERTTVASGGPTVEGTVRGDRSVGGAVGTLGDASTLEFGAATVRATVAADHATAGGLVGTATNATVTVDDVEVAGDLEGNRSVGGLLGRGEAGTSVDLGAVRVEDLVQATNETAGGLVGALENATLATGDVTVADSVLAASSAGGLVGAVRNASAVRAGNVTLSGDVSTDGDGSGGVVGSQTGGQVGEPEDENAVRTGAVTVAGPVTGDENVGGVVGFQGTGVTATTDDVTVSGAIQGSVDVGGAVGFQFRDAALSTGHVSVDAGATVDGDENVGGVAGYQHRGSDLDLATATVDGDVNGGAEVGGLVGMQYQENALAVEDVAVNGSVRGASNVGGLVGFQDANSTATGGDVVVGATVNGTSSVGGAVGFQQGGARASLDAVRVTEPVVGDHSVGGVVGFQFQGSELATDDVRIEAGVDGGSNTGGVVGFQEQDVSMAVGDVTVAGPVDGARIAVGGVVGAQSRRVDSSVGTVLVAANVTGDSSTGGIVGFQQEGVNATYGDVAVRGTVSGGPDVGGLVGSQQSDVTVRTGDATVEGAVRSDRPNVGGLVGYQRADVDVERGDVTVRGTVTGDVSTGGLVGFQQENVSVRAGDVTVDASVNSTNLDVGGLYGFQERADASFEDVAVLGPVSGESQNVGGLTGYQLDARLDASRIDVRGDVTGSGHNVGGLAGFQQEGVAVHADRVLVAGDVRSTDEGAPDYGNVGGLAGFQQADVVVDADRVDVSSSIAGGWSVGGLAGFQRNDATVTAGRVRVNGTVLADQRHAGGLAGFVAAGVEHDVDDLVVAPAVEGGNGTGGLAGAVLGADLRAETATVDATVEGWNDVGGLVGQVDGGSVERIGATVDVEGRRNVGGVAGAVAAGRVASVAVNGSVDGGSTVGGAVGNVTASGVPGATPPPVELTNLRSGADVAGERAVGGLVGDLRHRNATVTRSVAFGAVDGATDVGGALGARGGGAVGGLYYDADAAGAGDSPDATGRSPDAMTGVDAVAALDALEYPDAWVPTEGYPDLAWRSDDAFRTTRTLTLHDGATDLDPAATRLEVDVPHEPGAWNVRERFGADDRVELPVYEGLEYRLRVRDDDLTACGAGPYVPGSQRTEPVPVAVGGGDGGDVVSLPRRRAIVTPSPAYSNRTTTFRACTDGDQPEWGFGDGESGLLDDEPESTATGTVVTHEYDAPGTYEVSLTAENETTTRDLEVVRPPVELRTVNSSLAWTAVRGVPATTNYTATIHSQQELQQVVFQVAGQRTAVIEPEERERLEDGSQLATYRLPWNLSRLDDDATLEVRAVDVFDREASDLRRVVVYRVPWVEWSGRDGGGERTVHEGGPDPRIELAVERGAYLQIDALEDHIANIPFEVQTEVLIGAWDTDRLVYNFAEPHLYYAFDQRGTVEALNRGFSIEADGYAPFERASDGPPDFVAERVTYDFGTEVQIGLGPKAKIQVGGVGVEFDVSVRGKQGIRVDLDPHSGNESVVREIGPYLDTGASGVAGVDLWVLSGEVELAGNHEYLFTVHRDDPQVRLPVGSHSDVELSGRINGPGVECEVSVGPVGAQFGAEIEQEPEYGEPIVSAGCGLNLPVVGGSGSPEDEALTAVGAENATSSVRHSAEPAPSPSGWSATDDVTAISNRSFADDQPSVARVDGTPTVLYRTQRTHPDAGAPDVAVRTRTAAGWSEPTYLTPPDNHSHATPQLAADGDRALASWTALDADLARLENVSQALANYEVAVAAYDGSSWSEPTTITAGDGADGRPRVAPAGDGWLVAWEQASVDGENDSLLDPDGFRVRYAVLDANGSVDARGAIDDARRPRVGASGDDAVLTYRTDASGQSTLVSDRIAVENGSRTTAATYAVEHYGDHAAARDRLVWSHGNATDPVLSYATPDGVRTVGLGDDVTSVSGLDLVPTDDGTLLTYRARIDGAASESLVYRLERDGAWIHDRRLAVGADDALLWQQSSVPTDDGFRTVFAGTRVGDDRTDLFEVDHGFRPDYAVSASTNASEARPGTNVTVDYALENVGDVAGDEPVTVAVRSGNETIVEARHDALAPGERSERSVRVPADETGTLAVVADPAGDLDQLERANDRAVVTTATPTLRIEGIETRRAAANGTVVVSVANDGVVPATDVPVAVVDEGAAVGNATLHRAPAGSSTTATASVDPEALSTVRPQRIVLDPRDDVGRVERRASRPRWLFQPDLTVGPVDVARNETGVEATVTVGNRGPAGTNATVALLDEAGERVGATNTSLPPAVNGTAAFRRIPVAVAGVEAGDELTAVADAERPDADVSTTAHRTTVGSLGGAAGPSVTLDAPATGTAGTTLEFRANASADAPERFEWTFGAAANATTANATVAHAFDEPGSYPVTVTVVDGSGRTATITDEVVIEAADPGDGGGTLPGPGGSGPTDGTEPTDPAASARTSVVDEDTVRVRVRHLSSGDRLDVALPGTAAERRTGVNLTSVEVSASTDVDSTTFTIGLRSDATPPGDRAGVGDQFDPLAYATISGLPADGLRLETATASVAGEALERDDGSRTAATLLAWRADGSGGHWTELASESGDETVELRASLSNDSVLGIVADAGEREGSQPDDGSEPDPAPEPEGNDDGGDWTLAVLLVALVVALIGLGVWAVRAD